MLEVSALRGGYGRIEVLRGIDLGVRDGEVVALLGSTAPARPRSTTPCPACCRLFPAQSASKSMISPARATRKIVAAGLVHVPKGGACFQPLRAGEPRARSYRRARREPCKEPGTRVHDVSEAQAAHDSARGRCRAASSRCSPSAAA